jgi:hypothetical protein
MLQVNPTTIWRRAAHPTAVRGMRYIDEDFFAATRRPPARPFGVKIATISVSEKNTSYM